MLGINLKLPGANFLENTQPRRNPRCLSRSLQISPGRGEAGAALQGAKNLHLGGAPNRSFKEELAKNRWRVLSFCSTPISALLCSAAYGGFSPASFKYSRLFLMARWVKFNFLTCAVLRGGLLPQLNGELTASFKCFCMLKRSTRQKEIREMHVRAFACVRACVCVVGRDTLCIFLQI